MIDRRSDALVFIDEGRGIVVCVGASAGREGTDSHNPRAKIETPNPAVKADLTSEALGDILAAGVGLGNVYEIVMLAPDQYQQDRIGVLVAVAINRETRLQVMA
jgi:hypothetical protein